MITPEQLAAWKAAEEKEAGQWPLLRAEIERLRAEVDRLNAVNALACAENERLRQHEQQFSNDLGELRTAVPALIAEVERLQGEIAMLKNIDCVNWDRGML